MPEQRKPDLEGAPRNERYEIIERIGQGGMGLVFLARDRRSGEEIALKTLRVPGPESLYRLKHEFRALRDIAHANLVRLYELEEDGFFTMELVRGTDFVSAVGCGAGGLAHGGERLRGALRQLADGLGELHAHGKLHRDVKPSNVMIDTGDRVVLLDFGLVLSAEEDARRAAAGGAASGTFAYMAREQAWGRGLSPATDWYGVGVLLYECLTGRLPFGEHGASAFDEAAAPPHPCSLTSEAPADLAELALALLRGKPELRAGEPEVRAVSACTPPVAPRASRPPARRLPFVGRAAERACLEEAFGCLGRGGPVMVSVEGASGIGKSALIEHFLASLAARDAALVLRSRCHPQESVRFEAVDGLVDELSRQLLEEPPDLLADLPPAGAAALPRVFPVLGRVPLPTPSGDALDGAEPLAIRRAAFAALRILVARIAERRPTVLWIDDLQWGDADSGPLLRELLRAQAAPAALFVFSYRSDEKAGSALLAEIESVRSEGAVPCFGIELAPLSPLESREVAAGILAGTAGAVPELTDRVVAEAGGSPIFLAQLARALARRPGSLVDGEELTLCGVIQERVRALPQGAVDLIEAISVAGGPLPRSALIEAAGVGAAARDLVGLLQHEQLVRTVPAAGEPSLDTYHDRVRECIAGAMPPEIRRGRHQALLDPLEHAAWIGPEVLLRHAEGAGEVSRAAGYAVAAGDRASAALAFGQAAGFYRRALELRDWSALDRRALRERQAGSLVNAGRCADAAPVYLEAAHGAGLEQNLDLRRLAAEQYMVSGRTEDGLLVLDPLLAELGLHLPRSAQRALVSTAARLARLAVRGTHRFRERSEAELGRIERTRIDVCFSGARGLIMSDTVRAGYLPLVGLGLALRAGEPRRVGRSLAMVAGAVLTPFGGPLARWRDRMLLHCDEIAERTGDAYVAASASLARGQIGIMSGDWRKALEQSESALAILGTQCRGVNWEKNVAHAAELRALDELGELAEAGHRAGILAEESRELGDRYGAVVAALMLGITQVAADRPDEGRRQLRAAFEGWPQHRYLIQHFYALRIEVLADLYEGRVDEAWHRLDEGWPQIQDAQFLRVPAPRIDALALRGRAALARARHHPEERRKLLRAAASDAKRLLAEPRADARGHGNLLRAGAAGLAGDTAVRRRALADAQREFECAEMTRWSELCDEKPAAFAHADVANPAAWRATWAPGI